MNKDKIRPAPPRKRKKMCDVEYYDVEDIAPAAAQARPCQVHEWKGMDAHVSAYQYSMDALHSSQLPQSYWYSSLFSTAAPTSLEDESWSIHDDVISQYDPVLDEQLPLKSKNARVRFDPLNHWRREIPIFLDELLRLDGRGDFAKQKSCSRCEHGQASFHCRDCFSNELMCQTCIVTFHAHSPFHRIEHWDNGFFTRVTLKDLGLRIQLGHSPGEHCALPQTAKNDSFLIIDTYGVHNVGLDFCGCESSKSLTIQLLRYRLYPATLQNPQTAATFRALETFHLLSFESKASAHEFYRSIARQTDNTGLLVVRDRYTEFLRMVREWRHLKMLKRAGQGHLLRLEDAGEGSCAVLCPACPHPGINLPSNWKEVPPGERWKYTLFIALDANFRMRRKKVSSEAKDPSLCDGLGYFVTDAPYTLHLAQNSGAKQERSTCVSHDALNSADTKDTQGCVVTGLAAADCSRHDFRRPVSVGDLQRGERYINMDYVFFSGLSASDYSRIVVSYDIACQWGINFPTRMATKFPSEWSINSGQTTLTKLVPKFHLPAHVEKCQRDFSFNYAKYVGRTDGEAPERGWAKINGLAGSTREMGPGSRRDTIEDHMGDANWKKTVGIGLSLLRKIKEALPQRTEHAYNLQQLESVIESSQLEMWRAEIEAWETDNSKPNPFEPREKPPTQNQVRLALANKDAAMAGMNDGAVRCDVSASVMISMGLEMEELQRKLRFDISNLGLHATALQRAKVQERTNGLQRRIESWQDVQAIYIPSVALLRGQVDSKEVSEVQAYDIQLWLPSAIGLRASCDQGLRESEWALREAQANDALTTIRQHLRLDSFLTKRKKDWSRGVRANTRSQTVIMQNQLRLKAAVDRYRTAFNALSVLEPLLGKPVYWRHALGPLLDDDIRGLPVDGLGEGRRTLSWIWTVQGVMGGGDQDPGLHDALRIQWCRARARKLRWSEEVDLLVEEMRWVKEFLAWQAKLWAERSKKRKEMVNEQLQEGLSAYAHRQAHIRLGMKMKFEELWKSVDSWLAGAEIPVEKVEGDVDNTEPEDQRDDSKSMAG